MLFQAFVYMQLFNLVNAKKLGEREYNICNGLFNNIFFIAILVMSFLIQMAMVEYGGRSIRAVPLTTYENMVCLIIGAFTLVWGLVIKLLVPASWFNRFASSAMQE